MVKDKYLQESVFYKHKSILNREKLYKEKNVTFQNVKVLAKVLDFSSCYGKT